MTNRTPLAVYIHWPFCRAKCPYCDFNSHVREQVEQDRWRAALITELEYMAKHLPPHAVTSIFFGGGTPSLMPAETVAALIERVNTLFPAENEPEITLEANPTSSEAESFAALARVGVNRISLGVQSLRAEGLRFLGREHSAGEALHAVELAATHMKRYSFDMIYARPGQTTADWEAELREALPYIDGHSSLYQLTIEEETPFARFHAAGSFTLPEDDAAAEMYALSAEILREKGLLPYEISNYATPGQECFHNVSIWRGMSYLGIGPGAHGRCFYTPDQFAEDSSQLHATRMLKSPERWLSQVEKHGHGIENAAAVSDTERFEERILMGLRLTEGMALADLHPTTLSQALLNSDRLATFMKDGVMERNDAHIRITEKGRLLQEHITHALLTSLDIT